MIHSLTIISGNAKRHFSPERSGTLAATHSSHDSVSGGANRDVTCFPILRLNLDRGRILILFRKPSAEFIHGFVAEQSKLELTYTAIGATANEPPSGYVVDHTRVKLGQGESPFHAAKIALQGWEQFRLSWLEAVPPTTPIAPDQVVVVMAHALGMWWLNTCRIVYVVDESGPSTRFGFAYGTLPDHVESGEERFLIEWDHANDSVWYDIVAFSRPRHFLVRLAYPIARRKQKQFARESAAAMIRAASSATLAN